MRTETKTWLYDILNSINEIESYFDGPRRDFNEYSSSLKTKRAVERNLEIIGEAMNRILNSDSTMTFTSSRKIADTRNRIIHGYDTVSDEVIWGIIVRHLPTLKSEVESFLNIP